MNDMESPPAAQPGLPLTAQCEIDSRGSRWYLVRLCFVASLGGFLFGFDTAVISGTVNAVEAQYSLTKFLVGWFGSSALVGCILGAAVAGWISDRYGRKPALIAASVLLFVSALYSMIPQSFTVLTWARLIGGGGVGIASVIAPMYISEFSPAHLRGRLVALYQLSIVLGILAAYYTNWVLLGFSKANPNAFEGIGWMHWVLVTEVWRGMFGIEMIPCAAFFAMLFIIPESPRWLVKAGRNQQALRILTAVEGGSRARSELRAIERSLYQDVGSLRELFRPGLRLALIVAVGLSFFGQLTGVNIIVYYGPIILKDAGFESANALQWQVVLGLINLVATLVAIWKIDSWGRRPLLVGGMAAVTVTMGLTGLMMVTHASPLWIVALLCLYMAFVAVSICGVIWVLTPEIFPNRLRGRAASVATFVNWSTNMVGVFLYPWYVDSFGAHAGMLTFSGICFVATVFFWKLVPETKGKTLEEVSRQMERGGA